MNMESTDSERGRDMITRASIVEAGLMADSSIAWEKKRQLWLAPKRSASSDEEGRNDAVKTSFVDEAGSTSTTKPMRRRIVNPATVERARLLEELLDEAIRQDVMKRRDAANSAASTLALDAGSSSASAAVPAASKVMKDMGARGDEPDGGVVIRIENKGTLAEATRAILSAFREGRRLKDPLPLNLVVSYDVSLSCLLYSLSGHNADDSHLSN